MEILISYMATTDFFIQQLAPTKYRKGDDIGRFIQKCEEFFKVSHYSPSDTEILIKCFLEEDMLQLYNRVDVQIKGYAAKLRKAFTKETNLLQEMRNALEFKQNNEDPHEFFDKVEKLADKIFTEKLTRETFIELLLIEASKEKDLHKQLIMSNTTGIVGIKEKIEKLHLVQTKTDAEIMTLGSTTQKSRNYAEIVKGSPQERTRYNSYNYGDVLRNGDYGRDPMKQGTQRYPASSQRYYPRRDSSRHMEYTRRTMTCWSCQTEGHLSRDCPRRVVTCFACKEQGHIRRNCPIVRCRRCQNNGHEEAQCFTNLERKRLGYSYEDGRRDGNPRRYRDEGWDINKRGYGHRHDGRQITYLDCDLENQGDKRREKDDGHEISRDVKRDEYPNEYASSEGGLIGAIH